ncbi:catabolite regulation protein CreA [Colwellia sp. MT41]|uniref:CreA family protein n=1 Tax=Colwellia sp. MT41 TaxID=58049 RepID=UPI0007176C1A|nr:CreA family protein [Colwellia sp. MT41]ALO36569.1 catabolite regulation protein CreA [Colwellia sp. MT41]
MLKKIKIYGSIFILLVITLFIINSLSKDEVGDISLGMFTLKDIKINTLIDPLVPGITCHIANVEDTFSLSDPSDSSISCRQTGLISSVMIAKIDKSKSGEVVFKKSKSIFLKTMKVRRIFDAKNQTLMYLSYATKETSGSFKHSLSTVPLWGTKAYVAQTISVAD